MKPTIILIGKIVDPTFDRLIDMVRKCEFEKINLIYKQDDLGELKEKDFRGFLIYCLQSEELIKWSGYITNNFPACFKVYFYDSLIEENLKNSILLNFDFAIAGKNHEKDLHGLLAYLKINYWKKIPGYVFSKNGKQISDTCRRIINAFEILDIQFANIKNVSTKLDIDTFHIKREIISNLNMNFSDLKETIKTYYYENFPDKLKLSYL